MNEQDKQLLLQDLCARLPYGVIVQDRNGVHVLTQGNTEFADLFNGKCNIKPYLRPISSMTEEEEIEYDATFATIHINGHYDSVMTYKSFDWLNANHFDSRNLIEKGLAIAAPEGMYEV